MPKSYNIRWSDNDNQDLARAVKNYNAKISRLEKKYPEIKNTLPERTSVREMKDLIGTRQDLKREINSLKRFSSKENVIQKKNDGTFEGIVDVPGSKYNLKTTKWQKEEMTRRVSFINRKRKQRLEETQNIEQKSRGVGLGYTKGEIGMGMVDDVALQPMKPFYPTMSQGDLNKRFKAMQLERQVGYWQKKELTLKWNVINGILTNYGDPKYRDDVNAIIKAIEDMSFREFYERFMSETGVMEIVSPPPGSSMDDQLQINVNALKSIWIPNHKPEG